MIEVTQKDHKGRIQTVHRLTEKQFGERYTEQDVKTYFDTEHKMIGSEEKRVDDTIWHRYAIFNNVAYNEKGKVLDPSYLIGLVRKYHWRWRRTWIWHPWAVRYSRGRKGGSFRHMKTTQERRWAHAWDDEEFAPKVRSRRNAKHLPNCWDDWWRRDCDNNNWKRYRKHQWKEKK